MEILGWLFLSLMVGLPVLALLVILVIVYLGSIYQEMDNHIDEIDKLY